ncbi:MAG: hypothetical protein ACRENB_06790, partial [Gemmatimonadales bacterium]
MSELDAASIAPSQVTARLATAGWPADHPAVRAAFPVAARGHNLVVSAPPSPAWSAPAVAGALGRRAGSDGLVVLLAPAESVDEWARLTAFLAADTGLRITAAHTTGRLTRLLRAEAVDVLVVPPETAVDVVRRAALKLESVRSVILAWPERWSGEDTLTVLLGDVPREAQRIVVTADAAGVAEVIERYAWRAPVADLMGSAPSDPAPAVRTVAVPWRRRLDTIPDLIEQLDPASTAVWTADSRDHPAIAEALGRTDAAGTIVARASAEAGLVIAYDLPSPADLRTLGGGDIVLLVPPGAEPFVSRIAPARRPLLLPGVLDKARADQAQARQEIVTALERGASESALLALAPVLERFEAPAVAAVLWDLWRAPAAERPAAAPA